MVAVTLRAAIRSRHRTDARAPAESPTHGVSRAGPQRAIDDNANPAVRSLDEHVRLVTEVLDHVDGAVERTRFAHRNVLRPERCAYALSRWRRPSKWDEAASLGLYTRGFMRAFDVPSTTLIDGAPMNRATYNVCGAS